MEWDIFTITGAAFGLLGLFIFYKVYDYVANRNPYAFQILGVNTKKMIILQPVEHQLMWADEIYDVLIKGTDAYIPKLRKSVKIYENRTNTKLLLGYKLDDGTIVDPYFCNMPIEAVYEEEYKKLVGDAEFRRLEAAMKESGISSLEEARQKGVKSLPVAMVASLDKYAELLMPLREKAKIEAARISSATPETLKEKVIGAAPIIMITVGMMFFFVMLAMNTFSMQAESTKIVTTPLQSNLVCQQSLATCQGTLIDVIKGKNITIKTNSSTPGILDVLS